MATRILLKMEQARGPANCRRRKRLFWILWPYDSCFHMTFWGWVVLLWNNP